MGPVTLESPPAEEFSEFTLKEMTIQHFCGAASECTDFALCGNDNFCHIVDENVSITSTNTQMTTSNNTIPCTNDRDCGCVASSSQPCVLTGAVVEPVPIEPEYADIARTICRELNECGDGDEELCTEIAGFPLYPTCVELGCCAITNIPPL